MNHFRVCVHVCMYAHEHACMDVHMHVENRG